MSDPKIERRVRQEVDAADLADPDSIDAMRYLEGCLQEAMRLWPTTPLLARETTRPIPLGEEQLEPGTQVMLLNVFNHRAPDHVDGADRLMPERWQGEARNYCFNHLSNGSQDCPGGPLVLLLGKAVIARIMSEYRLGLEHPTGLNFSLWTRDTKRGRLLARRLQAGTVNINEGYISAWGSFDAPMGGMKHSGLGRRHGTPGIVKYTEQQTVAVQRVMPLAPPPFVGQRLWATLITAGLRLLRRLPGVR